jgi:hypothetical protein
VSEASIPIACTLSATDFRARQARGDRRPHQHKLHRCLPVLCRLPDGRLFSVIGFTIADGRVVEMDILADPDRLGRLDLSAVEG